MASTPHIKIVGNIVYAEPVEGSNISKQEVDLLHDAVINNISGSGNIGLIEIRPGDTSIDPVVYRYAKEIMPTFTAFALVTESDLAFKLFNTEVAFMKDIQSSIFRTIEEAEVWMQAVLANEDQS
jgi:hypothetical protein